MIKRLEHVEALTQAVLHATKKRFGASSDANASGSVIWGEEAEDSYHRQRSCYNY